MPPKPKFSKNEIVAAAKALAARKGADAVVAREVAKELGATTGPIFTYFDTMEELKAEVYTLAMQECIAYVSESKAYSPAFKEFGIRWIRYAKENPHLFAMLFLKKDSNKEYKGFINKDFYPVIESMYREVARTFAISEMRAEELVYQMIIYAQGIAALQVNGLADFPEEYIRSTISTVCISLVNSIKIKENTFNLEMATLALNGSEAAPVRK